MDPDKCRNVGIQLVMKFKSTGSRVDPDRKIMVPLLLGQKLYKLCIKNQIKMPQKTIKIALFLMFVGGSLSYPK